MSEYTPGPWEVRCGSGLVVCSESTDINVASASCGSNPWQPRANARLIAAAPDTLDALKALLELFTAPGETSLDTFERIGEVFFAETGMLRPGKSEPPECDYEGRNEERREAFDAWISKRLETARAAITKAEARNAPGR